MTTVSLGPHRPRRELNVSACVEGRMARRAPILGEGRPVRVSSQYHASASSMPPPTAPTKSPAQARSVGERSASASASRAAAIAKRSARARLREGPSEASTSAGTSAPIRERKPSVSIAVSGRIAHVPLASPVQKVLAPVP